MSTAAVSGRGSVIAAIILLAASAEGLAGLYDLNERFGVVSEFSSTGRDISQYEYDQLGQFGWYVDGEADYPGCPGPVVGPAGEIIERIAVVGGAGSHGPPDDGAAEAIFNAHPDWYPPGSVWMVGNELGNDSYTQTPYRVDPRSFLVSQYARSFHEWRRQIRGLDPDYRLMFGVVVPGSETGLGWDTRPFLTGLFRRYHAIYGEPLPVDVFNLRLYFGADALNVDALKSAVIGFRRWMSEVELTPNLNLDYSDSELWLTGYGLADPAISGEQARSTLREWTDWLCGYSTDDVFDSELGLAEDDFRLVQRWAWFALDDSRPLFGSTLLFDQQGKITPLGLEYASYLQSYVPEPASVIYLVTAIGLVPGRMGRKERRNLQPETIAQ